MDKVSAVLFDFDGVLGDTLRDNLAAWRYAFAPYNVEVSPHEVALLEGLRSPEIASILAEQKGVDPLCLEGILNAKSEHYSQHHKFTLYPGVGRLIIRLKKLGVKVGIVSGGSIARIERSAGRPFLELFDVVVAGESVAKGKPAPDPYLTAAAAIDVSPAQCIAIENAPLGITSVRAAGMYCIGVTTTLPALLLTEANIHLSDLIEAGELVERLVQKRDGKRASA